MKSPNLINVTALQSHARPPHFAALLLLAAAGLTLPAPAATAPAGVSDGRPAPAGRTQRLATLDAVPEGLSAPDWSSIRQQYEQQRHAAVPVDGGHQARNPGQQWLTRFDGRGFITRPAAGGWQWGLELRSYGFPGHERAIAPDAKSGRVSAEGQRVVYAWDDTVQEWFVNDQRGLEHGFTLKDRPAGAPSPNSPSSTLDFLLAVRGGLRPEVLADGRAVRFVDAHGAAALTYAGLTVLDADGRSLPARFEPVEGREDTALYPAQRELRLVVDERGARYPLTIDPIAQQAYLKASNTGCDQYGDYFGYSVAVSGDTVVVGAHWEDSAATGVNGDGSDNSAPVSGAAYVFVRSGNIWVQQAYLKASNTEVIDQFGVSVAISGDTVVVGACLEDSAATGVNGNQSDNSAPNSGAAYVFVRSGTTWSQQAYLKASNTGANDRFGYRVAVAGDTVVIGAYWEDSAATGVNGDGSDNSAVNAGAAYIFARSGTTWSQQAYLKGSNTEAGDWFGWSVAVAGDTVVVGAFYEDSNATGVNGNGGDNSAADSGAAYVFVRDGTNWSQQAYLKASNTDALDLFGASVAVLGDTAVVGAYQEDSIALQSGAAYVFVRSGTTWTQQAYLKASTIGAGDFFGWSVALSGNTLVVGADYEDSNATGVNGNQSDNSATESGAAYVFDLNASIGDAPEITVEQPAGTDLSDGSASVDFGSGLVGGNSQRTFTIRNSGNVALTGLGITITGANASDFVVTAHPTAPVSGPCASTTFTVAFSPGAAGARTAALHIACNDSDENPFDITLTGTGLTPLQIAQQAYLKASNTAAGDWFGWSVAVWGDTMVVGAPNESSSAVGVNGDESNNSAPNSGAAYVFVRSGDSWIQQAYLKASNAEAEDNFGWTVAISGDTVVVGAYFEDSNATGINGNEDDNSATNSGAAYVFVRSGTNWTQQAYLKASNTEGNEGGIPVGDGFGLEVAVSGDTVVIGAPYEDSAASGVNGNQNDNSAWYAGATYVFVRTNGVWSQQAYLKASNPGGLRYFGSRLDVSGNTVVVSATYDASGATGVNGNQYDYSAPQSGAVYIFVRDGTNWSQEAYLKASNTDADDVFGYSLGIWGDTVVVGAPREDSSATGVNGDQSDNSSQQSGAAYVFVRTNGAWFQQAYLKASNTGAEDWFGFRLAVMEDTIIVGAIFEDSNARGVNGDQSDNSAPDSGAAYLFVRDGTNWSQRAYLKAANAEAGDWFGSLLALSGGMALVGAPTEDSEATGVNGDPCDNSATDSGAAYLFDLNSSIGATPEIAVEQPSGTDLSDGSASVDFGSGLVGSNSELTFTIRNTGNADLTGLGITITGANASNFAVTAHPTAPVSGPCASTTFTVAFSPGAAGARIAALLIASNDADENPFEIALTGQGLSFTTDTDGDGLPDYYELAHTTPPSATALNPNDDLDHDGLTSLQEYQLGTDPNKADTDGDGVNDGAEINHPTSYFAPVLGTFTYPQAVADAAAKHGRVASFPNAADYTRMAGKARQTTQGYLWIGLSDAVTEGTWLWTDGTTATYSRWLAGEPSGGAAENHVVIMENSNQWTDTMENHVTAGYIFERVGLDPLDPDTDADGLTDGQEVNTTHSSPVLDDTDGDGLLDGAEINTYGSSPLLTDTDADGLNDREEVEVYHSNPAAKDSDGDGFDDLFEVNTGFDPALASSTPDALSTIRTAVEFRFNAADGVSYRIEASTDLTQWDIIELTIIGQSAVVTRFYSTENMPKRYFRVRRN
ncbi:MAG: choice-of-anchor D domain-containing protein [Verrucomicrobia bacterium]|nr:choice-of-anchor D domain-containing protein [Verrucomicrobiota bacterium]